MKHSEDILEELAEKRTIEKLGLTENEVITAKAYETTKLVELDRLKHKIEEYQTQQKEVVQTKSIWSKIFKGN